MQGDGETGIGQTSAFTLYLVVAFVYLGIFKAIRLLTHLKSGARDFLVFLKLGSFLCFSPNVMLLLTMSLSRQLIVSKHGLIKVFNNQSQMAFEYSYPVHLLFLQ